MFVCFAPLYFVYGGTIPRDFNLFERMMSLLYALFFIAFLPFYSAFRYKVWVNWGLASYGVLIYLATYLYPAESLISGDNAKIPHMLLAVCFRGIYGMMQAPFAALSPLIGDKAASALVYWILPTALLWPFVLKVFRFYRRAYLSEQLNPMPKVQPKAAEAHSGPAVKPEVLGTVITAPEVAASPDEVTGMAVLSQNSAVREDESEEAGVLEDKLSEKDEPEAIPLADAIRPVEPDESPELKNAEVSGSLGEGHGKVRSPKVNESAIPTVIELGAPAPSAEKDGSGEASGGVIELGAPSSSTSSSPAAPAKEGSDGSSGDDVENNHDTL